MSLLALQRSFHQQLVDPLNGDRLSRESSAYGFAVYHNAYRAQLTDCLAETYPRTHAWIGGEAFLSAMRSHIECKPPSGWTLGAYGDGFDQTLARLYPADPEVAELASIEWLLSRAFEAEDADSLPTDAIAKIDWDVAFIEFLPSLRTVLARTNSGAIWSSLAAGDPPPAAAILPEPATTLVWRLGFTPCFRTVEMLEHRAIVMAATGFSFAEICAMLVGKKGAEEGVLVAGGLLGQWFADGLIHRAFVRETSCV